MRAFHMNLLTYNANTQFPAGGAAQGKHQALRQEMANYRANVIGGNAVHLAGFTEVLVADAANPANVRQALNDFGAALGIAPGAHGRQLAVIRCGRTVLQNSNEVVAIVLDGNAVIQRYGLLWFNNPNAMQWQDRQIASQGVYTANLGIPAQAVPDYRYIVYVSFTLNGAAYTVGFLHNRAPGNEQAVLVMNGLRALLEAQAPVALTLCGGDFNANSPVAGPGGVGQLYPPNGHHPSWYYSPGATTAAGNRYDYWISYPQLFQAPGATAAANATPTLPNPNLTGSDHRGVGILLV